MAGSPAMMVWTWCGWEPLQFYRRLGGYHEAQEGNALWAEEWRARLDSEECAAKLAEAGIGWVTTHLYKGFGLAAEAEEIAATAKMIANYHRHGVKVFTYIQYGTIMPESIVAETADAGGWGRVDWNGQHDGHPYEYGTQYWRAKPCANQPGFREYLLGCVDTAIDAGADGIWIDNLNADGCHCPRCQAAFQEYLRAHVSDPWQDFGLRELSHVTIPRVERPRDPVYQAWVRFRCEETKTSLRLLTERARQRKADVVVAVNVGIGNHQRAIPENGNWFGNLDGVDYTYAENGFFPRWEDGKIVSQHWPMGIAESVGVRVVPGAGVGGPGSTYPRPGVPSARQLRRSFAESAMLGGHALGGPYGLRGEDGGGEPILLRDAEYRQTHRRLVDWYAAHAALFDGSVNAAPVAVLYSFEAMLADEARSRQVFEAMVQVLLRHQVPFRYVLSDRLELPADVAVLILPHVLPVSDSLAAQIRAFVGRGGKVLATGRTSLYDEQMRQRRTYALADVFGCEYDQDAEERLRDGVWVNPQNGSVLLPGEWGAAGADGRPLCQVAGERLVQVLRTQLPVGAMPEVLSPLPQVVCSWRRLPDGRGALALLNYGDAAVHGIAVRPAGVADSAKLWSVEAEGVELASVGAAAGGGLYLPPLEVEAYVVFAR